MSWITPAMSQSPKTVSRGFNPTEALVDLLIGWPARIAAYFSWLGPLVARVVVGSVFLWSGWGRVCVYEGGTFTCRRAKTVEAAETRRE